jgi:hypothetical protein
LTRKIRYVIDPANEYPRNYSGHIKVTLRDGSVRELRQPHFRGGMREPLTREELIKKFHGNIAYGSAGPDFGSRLLQFCLSVEQCPDMRALSQFRG